MTMERRAVPELLQGCWQRRWIELADGTRDDTSLVVWLQLRSRMADVRLSAAALALAGRPSFAACTMDELRLLAGSDSSSGRTFADATIARWTTEIGFQPVSAYPEPGLLQWSDDGTVLTERAPSGAYVEEWHLVPGSRDVLAHLVLPDGAQWFRAGNVGVLVRNRVHPATGISRLDEIAERSVLEAALDCEFSFCCVDGESIVVEASTLPWRVGAELALPSA